MKFIIFDTETSGLPKTKIINPQTLNLWCYIVQFSYIIYDSEINDIIKIKDEIIKLPKDVIINEETTKINGLTNKICEEKGIELREIMDEFFQDLKQCDLLIGHNINFDLNILKVELMRYIYENEENENIYKFYLYYINNYNNIYCTLENSIKLCNIEKINKNGKPYLKFPKLIELHEKLFNNSPNNLHNSLNDILITLRCFMKMKYNMDINNDCKNFKKLSEKYKLL